MSVLVLVLVLVLCRHRVLCCAVLFLGVAGALQQCSDSATAKYKVLGRCT